MNEEEIKKIIESSEQYDKAKEYSLLGMVGDFYTRKMLSMVILIWSMGILFIAGAIYSGVRFFKTDDTRYQIMYAVIFITLIQWVGWLKVFAWQIIHRNSIKRNIKRLELRIAQLSEIVKSK